MKKYREETRNRTLTFYAKDLEALDAHSTYRHSTTDMIQEAIKDYLTKQGWAKPSDTEQAPSQGPVDLEPTAKDQASDPKQRQETEQGETEDPTEALPDYLKARRRPE